MFTNNIPTEPGFYEHRWESVTGELKEQVLFVGYVDCTSHLWQGTKKPQYSFKMKCCRPEEYLHADRLTPQEWGGYWRKL